MLQPKKALLITQVRTRARADPLTIPTRLARNPINPASTSIMHATCSAEAPMDRRTPRSRVRSSTRIPSVSITPPIATAIEIVLNTAVTAKVWLKISRIRAFSAALL